MKPLNIVFFGTAEFGIPTLEKLLQSKHKVSAVVTVPDKQAGRGMKLSPSPIKKYASSYDLPIFTPQKLKEISFLETLRKINADLFVVVAFRKLPRVVWELPPAGTINLHASLLPDYRGAAPINWAIINGETETGVTTFFINEKIDTGEIILQEKTEILPEDNASSLYDKLMRIGSDLVLKTVNKIARGKVKTFPQPKRDFSKKAPKLTKKNTRINWNREAEKIHNFIRGLSYYPGAWTEIKTEENGVPKKFIIYKSKFRKTEHNLPPGTIFIEQKQMKIAAKDGFIFPEIVKMQGKKQMNIASFLNGVKNKEGRELQIL